MSLFPASVSPLYGIVGAAALAFVPHFFKGYLVATSLGGYDNVHPRGAVEKAKHLNSKDKVVYVPLSVSCLPLSSRMLVRW